MKIKILLILSLLSLSFLSANSLFAQSQSDIAAMQKANSKKDKPDNSAEKAAAKAKKDAEKAEKEVAKLNAKAIKEAEKTNKEAEKLAKKAEKEVNKSNEKAEKEVKAKVEKEVKTKPVKVEREVKTKPVKAEKEAKAKVGNKKPTKTEKDTKVKVEKEVKVKEEKIAKAEKTSSPKERTSSRNKSAAASNTNLMNKPLKTWSLDIGLNFTNPQTDIRYHDFFGTLNPKNEFKYGGQLRVTKMFDNAIGLQAQFAYNRLQGVYDTLVPYGEDRNHMQNAGVTEGLYFRNNVIQGSLNIYWNISNTVFNVNKFYKAMSSKKAIKPRWFSLYAYTGIGFSVFDPHVMRLSDNASVEDPAVFPMLKFSTGRTTEVVVPAVLGAKIKLSKTIDLGFEYGYNFVFSDKLDGFNFDHPGRLKTDAYTHGSLVATIKLGSKKNDKEHIEWASNLDPIFNEISKIGSLKKKVDKLAKDEDEDGISDYFDKDVETKTGATVGANGLELDSDGDGIPDDQDDEKFTDNGAEVDENGVALDTDKDGVPDHKDLEDGTSQGEFVNFQGKVIDNHITVKEDKDGQLRNIALPSIFFDTDDASIKRDYEDELFQMALTIKRNKGLKFILEGHCDERGSDEYNKELGNRRAENVKKYLVENYKLDPAIFTIISKGRKEALSPRFNINRRVDVILAE